jgi:hypothetical protein
MNAEHTPGPWSYGQVGDDCFTLFFDDSGDGCGDGEVYISDAADDNSEANARLIAAAPDMLEALEGLLKNAPRPKSIRKDFSYTLYLEAAKTAIAKARGTE